MRACARTPKDENPLMVSQVYPEVLEGNHPSTRSGRAERLFSREPTMPRQVVAPRRDENNGGSGSPLGRDATCCVSTGFGPSTIAIFEVTDRVNGESLGYNEIGGGYYSPNTYSYYYGI